MMNIYANQLWTLLILDPYAQVHIIYPILYSTKFPIIYTYEENIPLSFYITTFIQLTKLGVVAPSN